MRTGIAQSLEQSSLAAWVNSSATVLGLLSGLHLIGFALVVGAALVCGLHMVGLAFADRPSREVTRTVGRGVFCGLLLSATTGALLLSPRLQSAIDNWIFLLKMVFLAAACTRATGGTTLCQQGRPRRHRAAAGLGRRDDDVVAGRRCVWRGIHPARVGKGCVNLAALEPTLQSLEQSWAGVLVRESLWGFPIVVGVHILSVAFSVGMFWWFDLRLLGIALTRSRVSVVYRKLMPWATLGFLSAFTTGSMLFAGFATKAAGSPWFRVKVVVLLLAGVNAVVYHLVTERDRRDWDDHPTPPAGARLAGFISLLAWVVVILCGRMMLYTMF